MVRRYARERLHRPRNQNPWAIKSSSVLVWSKRGTRCATGSGVPLDCELKQLKIAHISQLANNGGISEFRGKMAKQALFGGSAIAPIPLLSHWGSQCLWLAKNVGGCKPQRLGLAFTHVRITFDGWPGRLSRYRAIRWEKAHCGDTARADKHVQTRKKKMTVIEPEMQLPRFNDARAILIFVREIFRDSWKIKQPDESNRQTWCHCT